jgi:lysophospholipase L1-like esterase
LELNTLIKAYAEQDKLTYVDFHSLLKTDSNALQAKYTTDAVHLTDAAYEVIEPVIKAAIEKAIGE